MEVSRPRRSDPILHLEAHECDLLRQLLSEMKTLLQADLPRADEVTKRLFPDAFDDERESENFRELVGDELRTMKLAAVNALADQISTDAPAQIALTADAVPTLLAVLTDLRLAIGTRLGVTEETMTTEPDPSDPDGPALSVLHWLGWVQESVLAAISRGGGRK